VVGAPRGRDAGDLAAALQRRRLSGVGEGAARRAAVRAQWRVGRLPEPEPWLSRAARTAALVRGRLLLVMLLDPRVPAAVPPPSPAAERARARLEATEARVMRLAVAAQPDSLEVALTACAAAESDWLRQVAMHPSLTSHVGLEAAWRWHERSLAPVLDGIERGLEARLTPAQEALVPAVAFDRALRLERLAPDPSAIFFVNGRWAGDAKPVPVAATWALLLGPGTLAGALAGLALAAPRRRRRERAAALRLARGLPRGLEVRVSGLPAPPRARDAEAAWRSEIGWLHVVSGPDRARIAHGVGTLAAGFAARGERVLAVDAGQGLRLHERFGGDARWGLGECLDGEVPLLGAVQAAGRPGFYLLACGGSGLAGRWAALSGVLEEARRHFDRVILALGVGAPGAAALPLGGRVLEAWWAEPDRQLPRRASDLGDRLGISFTNLNLDWLMQGEREVVETPAARALVAPPAPLEAPAAEEAPPDEPAEVLVFAAPDGAPAAAEFPPEAPLALDCDREVRDRLRFMVWMRRVQAERRSAAPVEVGTEG
jgi:hypothetical protein